jgi:trk system potassium uptake protein TrkA
MERFAVIGLGRFGTQLATNLAANGAEVIAVDRDRRLVEDLRDRVTLAIAMDATDEAALRIQGIDQVDSAIVGIGHDFEAAALSTVLLKRLGLKRVISRAGNDMQAQILRSIGADGIVQPEDESADRWGNRLLAPFIIDHVELGEGYGLVRMKAPAAWTDRPLAEINVRNKHNVTIVAIKRLRAANESGGPEDREVILPQPDSKLRETDTLVIAGFDKDLKRLPR